MTRLLAVLLVAMCLPAEAALAGDDAPALRIAVFPLTSAVADVKAEWLEGAVTDALVKTSRYQVLARTQIDSVLAEQKLNNSDLVDPKAAVSVGRLLGATYIVTGSLISANFEPGFFSKDQFRARAQFQVVEVETGRIVLSETVFGVRTRLVMRRGDTLGKLSPAEREKSFAEVAASIGFQLADRVNLLHPLSGYVVKVDGARVALNLGASSGVKPGQEFIVYKDLEPIRDPITGAELAVERKSVARLVVTEVDEKISWTRVVVTYSPDAKAKVAGEVVDLFPARGLLADGMPVRQATARAAAIEPELERVRRARRGGRAR